MKMFHKPFKGNMAYEWQIGNHVFQWCFKNSTFKYATFGRFNYFNCKVKP